MFATLFFWCGTHDFLLKNFGLGQPSPRRGGWGGLGGSPINLFPAHVLFPALRLDFSSPHLFFYMGGWTTPCPEGR